jgi:hypothetical protein
VVLALARTALPFARTPTEEAQRWLRVMRMHGHVGAALQALEVGERALAPASDEPSGAGRRAKGQPRDVEEVCRAAMELARRSGAECVGTVHVLFAVLQAYGSALDHDLHRRGTSRDEPFARLTAAPAADVSAH